MSSLGNTSDSRPSALLQGERRAAPRGRLGVGVPAGSGAFQACCCRDASTEASKPLLKRRYFERAIQVSVISINI